MGPGARSAVVASNQFRDIDIHDGKMILEFRVPSIDKGGALETLLAELDPGAALFAGDDLGDLPGFAALRAWPERTGRGALNVAIGELEATRKDADHHCDDAASLMTLLGSIVPEGTP